MASSTQPRMLAIWAAIITFVLPALAWACPVCAGGKKNSVTEIVVMLSMIALPYALVATVVKGIRRVLRDADDDQDR